MSEVEGVMGILKTKIKGLNKVRWSKFDGMTIAELKNHARAFDTATKKEIFYGEEKKQSESFQMVVNEITQKEVVAVSKDYNLLQHADVINAVSDALLNLNIKGVCHAASYGNRMYANIIFNDVKFEAQGEEQFLCGVRILNSYDKTTGIMVLPQIMRVICSNGLVLNKGWVNGINIRHTSRLVNQFEEQIPQLLNQMVEHSKEFALMVDKCIGDSIEWEIVEKIMPVLIKQDKYRKAIADRLKQDHPDGSAYTRWELLNAITHLCTHDKQLRPTIEHQLQGIAEKVLMTPFSALPRIEEVKKN